MVSDFTVVIFFTVSVDDSFMVSSSTSSSLKLFGKSVLAGFFTLISIFFSYFLFLLLFTIFDYLGFYFNLDSLIYAVVTDLTLTFFYFLAISVALWVISTRLLNAGDKISILTERKAQLVFFFGLLLLNLFSQLLADMPGLWYFSSISPFPAIYEHYFGIPTEVFGSVDRDPSIVLSSLFLLPIRVLYNTFIQFFILFQILYSFGTRSEDGDYQISVPQSVSSISFFQPLAIFLLSYLFIIFLFNSIFRLYIEESTVEFIDIVVADNYQNFQFGLELFAVLVAVFVIPLILRNNERFFNIFGSIRSMDYAILIIVGGRLIITLIIMIVSIPSLSSIFTISDSFLDFPVSDMFVILDEFSNETPSFFVLLLLMLSEFLDVFFLSTALITAILMFHPNKIDFEQNVVEVKDPEELLYSKNSDTEKSD